jgi:hypothetical protein
MSTAKKPLQKLEILRYTYQQIDDDVAEMDSGWTHPHLTAPSREEVLASLARAWKSVRRIVAVVAVTPLLSERWRAALQLFAATLDQFLALESPDFKAGKDL